MFTRGVYKINKNLSKKVQTESFINFLYIFQHLVIIFKLFEVKKYFCVCLPELFRRLSSRNNGPARTSMIAIATIHNNGLPLPPYSPDLDPFDLTYL